VRRIVTLIALTASVGQGCASSPHPWPVDCPPAAPTQAQPIRGNDLEYLAGRYEVTLVALSYGSPSSWWRGRLELTPTDSLRRYYIETIGGPKLQGMRPLAGHFRPAGDSLRPGWDAEVEEGILYLGCRRCSDASPDELRLLAATPTMVWGLWYNPQSSFQVVQDSLGRPLPMPAGQFCLRRVT
jgi:hypothetical protein